MSATLRPGALMAMGHGVLLAVLAAVAFVAARRGIDFGFLARDPNYLARAPFYAGALSNFGVLMWSTAGTAALFAALVSSAGRRGTDRQGTALLAVAGLLSWMLAIDDLYMVHEIVAPRFAGVPQTVVLGGYAAIGAGWALGFRRSIMARHPYFLGWALALLAASAGVDQIRDRTELFTVWLEDGLKLAGAAAWGIWLCRVSFLETVARTASIPPVPAPAWPDHRSATVVATLSSNQRHAADL